MKEKFGYDSVEIEMFKVALYKNTAGLLSWYRT